MAVRRPNIGVGTTPPISLRKSSTKSLSSDTEYFTVAEESESASPKRRSNTATPTSSTELDHPTPLSNDNGYFQDTEPTTPREKSYSAMSTSSIKLDTTPLSDDNGYFQRLKLTRPKNIGRAALASKSHEERDTTLLLSDDTGYLQDDEYTELPVPISNPLHITQAKQRLMKSSLNLPDSPFGNLVKFIFAISNRTKAGATTVSATSDGTITTITMDDKCYYLPKQFADLLIRKENDVEQLFLSGISFAINGKYAKGPANSILFDLEITFFTRVVLLESIITSFSNARAMEQAIFKVTIKNNEQNDVTCTIQAKSYTKELLGQLIYEKVANTA